MSTSTPVGKRPASLQTDAVQKKSASAQAEATRNASKNEEAPKTPVQQLIAFNSDISKAEQEIQKLRGEISTLQKAIKPLFVRAAKASDRYIKKQNQIEEKEKQLATLSSTKQTKAKEIKDLNAKIETINKPLKGWFASSSAPVAKQPKEKAKENPEVTKLQAQISTLEGEIVTLTTQIEAITGKNGQKGELETLRENATEQQKLAKTKYTEAQEKRSTVKEHERQIYSKQEELAVLVSQRDTHAQTIVARSQPSLGLWEYVGYQRV